MHIYIRKFNAHIYTEPVNHEACMHQAVAITYKSTTYYKYIPRKSIASPYGPLFRCNHAAITSIPEGQKRDNVLCDGMQQYLATFNRLTETWMFLLLNDDPIEGEPHSAQAPQD